MDMLSQWRFEPGKKDGKPVAVAIHVETHVSAAVGRA
jgi:hypothetical protein